MSDIRVAVFGDRESIKGFAAIGLDTFVCEDFSKALNMFRKIIDGGIYGVVFVTEQLMPYLEKENDRLDDKLIPSIVPIPGVKGENGYGVERLKGFVEKAVGSDIIFND